MPGASSYNIKTVSPPEEELLELEDELLELELAPDELLELELDELLELELEELLELELEELLELDELPLSSSLLEPPPQPVRARLCERSRAAISLLYFIIISPMSLNRTVRVVLLVL